MTTPSNDSLLRRFRLSPDDLIGQGGESWVYALDGARILRIYKSDPAGYIERRKTFYDGLRRQNPPYEVPEIYDIDSEEGAFFSIEKRMKGRDFGIALRELNGADREKTLASYVEIAGRIGEVRLPDHAFGEVMGQTRSESWAGYLHDRAWGILAGTRRHLENDVQDFGVILDEFESDLRLFDGFSEKRLVHADYFPPNIFMDDDFNICGVGDFSAMTVVGDSRMDLASAAIHIEVIDAYRPEDSALLLRILTERHGKEIERILDFYRIFYSIYFSGCKESHPPTYAWCLGNFRSHLERRERSD